MHEKYCKVGCSKIVNCLRFELCTYALQCVHMQSGAYEHCETFWWLRGSLYSIRASHMHGWNTHWIARREGDIHGLALGKADIHRLIGIEWGQSTRERQEVGEWTNRWRRWRKKNRRRKGRRRRRNRRKKEGGRAGWRNIYHLQCYNKQCRSAQAVLNFPYSSKILFNCMTIMSVLSCIVQYLKGPSTVQGSWMV